MNHLYNKIKADQLAARKGGGTLAASILTYLLGEIGRQSVQDTSDKAVTAVLKTTVKRLKAAQKVSRSTKESCEIDVLSEYLDPELSGVELETLIRDLSFSTKGEAMGKIKGLGVAVNMQQASQIVTAILS